MVFLTKEEEKMLDGEYGAGTQEAMSILVKLAEAYGAERMIEANSAHVAAGLFLEEIEWYERLIRGGERGSGVSQLGTLGASTTSTGTRSAPYTATRPK